MPSYYTVVRFVPRGLAEEFINIGVLTFGDGRVRGRFLSNWRRVECFAEASSLANARAFQDWVEGTMVPEAPSSQRMRPLDEATLKRITHQWSGSVQLTEPRGSLADPDSLLEEVAGVFLVEGEEEAFASADDAVRRGSRYTKWRVLASTKSSLQSALAAADPTKHLHLAQNKVLPGVRPRPFDLVVSNGSPRLAVQCFNFRVADTKRVLDQIDATAFAVEDVQKTLKNLEVGVVAAGSSLEGAAMSQAKETLQSIGVTFLNEEEDDVEAWSAKVVAGL